MFHVSVRAAASLALCFAAQAAAAQNFINENTTIYSNLCVGVGCDTTETYSEPVQESLIRLDNNRVRIELIDASNTAGNFPTNDWSIYINDWEEFGESYFALRDDETGLSPFRVDAGAPANALRVTAEGDLGLGTSLPLADVHIVASLNPSLMFEQASPRLIPKAWLLHGDNTGFYLTDHTRTVTPFSVSPQAENNSLAIGTLGAVGVGTSTPLSPLHIYRDNGTAQMRIEETSGTQTARPLLNLVNHGRPDVIMANTATGGEWAFGAGTNFVLKNGAVGSSDGDKNLQLKLYGATGNLEIAGQIITGGPTCSGGCDAVFSASYDLPSIRQHAAEMFALGHLPNVGPTDPQTPINVTDTLGRVLNELEHAHIYIAELEARLARLEAKAEQ